MNTKTKHTPGPWEVGQAGTGNVYVPSILHKSANPKPGPGLLVRTIATMCIHGPEDENESNARLIAAAPELLEACKMAVEELGPNSSGDRCWDAFEKLLAAIAKAESTAQTAMRFFGHQRPVRDEKGRTH